MIGNKTKQGGWSPQVWDTVSDDDQQEGLQLQSADDSSGDESDRGYESYNEIDEAENAIQIERYKIE